MTRNKVAVTNNCSAMTVVFIPQVAEAIHQTINRKQQHPTSIGHLRRRSASLCHDAGGRVAAGELSARAAPPRYIVCVIWKRAAPRRDE